MRSWDATAAVVAVAGLLASAIGAGPASAHERAGGSATLSPRSSPLAPRVPTAVMAESDPRLLSSVAPGDGAAPAPWTMGQRIGLGMMLAAPLLAGSGFYHRGKAGSAPQAACGDGCRTRDDLMSDHARPQGQAAQWALLGAGVATFAGGGLLFWLDGPKAPRDNGPHAALRFGRNGLPSAVILGKF
jgi:hypothetical protein